MSIHRNLCLAMVANNTSAVAELTQMVKDATSEESKVRREAYLADAQKNLAHWTQELEAC